MERGLGRDYILNHRPHARQFLDYLKQHGISSASVQPGQLATYFRVALRIYQKHKPNRLKSLRHWRVMSRRSVHALLRFVQGEWPPGSRPPILERLRSELEHCRYHPGSIPSYLAAARQFLDYLRQQASSIEEAEACSLEGFSSDEAGAVSEATWLFAETSKAMAQQLPRSNPSVIADGPNAVAPA